MVELERLERAGRLSAVADAPEKVIQVYRVSGYVVGPCEKCGKEERALLMFEDFGMGWECLSCRATERVDRVEWIEGEKLPPTWGLG